MLTFVFLLLATTPDAGPVCGGAVVGSYFPTVPLKDADGKVLDTLKVEKGRLSEELPVVKCSDSLVLVKWRGRLAAVDRARVRFAQTMIVCPEGAMAGNGENQGNAASMGAFDPRCPTSKPKAARAK